MFAALTWPDAADCALAFFLVIVGLGLFWALVSVARAFTRLSSLIRGAQQELLPLIGKVGGSIDRVNGQLDLLDEATASAVDVAAVIDETVRTVGFSIRRPIEIATGLSAGLSHGAATLRTKRSWSAAVASAKEAAARRRADLSAELDRSRR